MQPCNVRQKLGRADRKIEDKDVNPLSKHIHWLASLGLTPLERQAICQCGTAELIQKSRDPERIRAVLMAYVFVDQFAGAHYAEASSEFGQVFRGPQLERHGAPDHGHAS